MARPPSLGKSASHTRRDVMYELLAGQYDRSADDFFGRKRAFQSEPFPLGSPPAAVRGNLPAVAHATQFNGEFFKDTYGVSRVALQAGRSAALEHEEAVRAANDVLFSSQMPGARASNLSVVASFLGQREATLADLEAIAEPGKVAWQTHSALSSKFDTRVRLRTDGIEPSLRQRLREQWRSEKRAREACREAARRVREKREHEARLETTHRRQQRHVRGRERSRRGAASPPAPRSPPEHRQGPASFEERDLKSWERLNASFQPTR